ncbi:hypothetical protein FRC17_003958, partial [Serendipita sp. 399]
MAAASTTTTPSVTSSTTPTRGPQTVIVSLDGTIITSVSENGVTTTAATAITASATEINSKPAERFLIGVLLGLFTILAICLLFLIRPFVLRSWRRFRNQQAAVEQIIISQRKVIRMRRPRLFEIWVDSQQFDGSEESDPLFGTSADAQRWDSQK